MKIARYNFNLGCKIAVLADIHNSEFDLSVLEKEKIDIILMPGDICSNNLSKEAWENADPLIRPKQWFCPNVALRLFHELPKLAPTFFSLGNHEIVWSEIDKEIVRQSGTILLDNSIFEINGFAIGGISSFTRHSSCLPVYIYNNVRKNVVEEIKKRDGKKILLLHEPQLYEKYDLKDKLIDLVVSGHAHGGQWRIFNQGIFAPGQGILPKYTRGIYNGNLLVSAGMANTTFVPRFFNPTEIVIVE